MRIQNQTQILLYEPNTQDLMQKKKRSRPEDDEMHYIQDLYCQSKFQKVRESRLSEINDMSELKKISNSIALKPSVSIERKVSRVELASPLKPHKSMM
jgi:hypothetical protein